MTIPREPWLVALSIAIAIQGSFVGLSLARELDSAEGFRRRLAHRRIGADARDRRLVDAFRRHAGRQFSQRHRLSGAADPDILSHLRHRGRRGSLCGACLGLSRPAYRSRRRRHGARRQRDALLRHVGGPSRGTDVARAVLPRRRGRDRDRRQRFRLVGARQQAHAPWLFLGAVGLGLAISGMHYTAMAGMRLDPLCFDTSRFVGAESALSRNTLALLATIVSFGVSGAFLLSLVPDGRAPRSGAEPDALPAVLFAPAHGGDPTPSSDSFSAPAPSIPVEKDGRTRELAVADIYAIRVNAHYTYIHDGEQEYFCNLSISALEARLDPKAFLRVHRSHIVSVDRIARVKRAGEAGVAELGLPVRCSIPIARAHYRDVKLRIGTLAG
jgi:diguanylate cyclase